VSQNREVLKFASIGRRGKAFVTKQTKPRPRGGMQSVMWLVVLALLLAFYYFYTRPGTPAAAPPPTATPTLAATAATTTAPLDQPATAVALPAAAALAAPAAETTSAPPTAAPSPTLRPARATPTRGPPATIDGLPTILPADLPPEALDTLDLIDRGGPFPFSRDGVVFQNREQLLPRQPQGYYHEYTVITPGSSDRGARRIIAGEAGERYYTDDHYDSFYVVVGYP
jgi:ribonuclease T1